MPGKLNNSYSIFSITARCGRRILRIHVREPADGGSGSRISATEGLFTAGKLMVVERRNFQRVYDLTHRVMPHWDDERDLLPRARAELFMLDNSARSLGIFREQWLADYYRLKRPDLQRWRETRAEQQQIIPVEVDTLGTLWLHAELLPLLEQAQAKVERDAQCGSVAV